MQFPKHEAGLILTHNDHKNVYQTVAQSIERKDHCFRNWVSEEQKQKAIDTNDCWSIQWYPKSPIGSYSMVAADLDVLLEAACNN
jgi:hypothetical protein